MKKNQFLRKDKMLSLRNQRKLIIGNAEKTEKAMIIGIKNIVKFVALLMLVIFQIVLFTISYIFKVLKTKKSKIIDNIIYSVIYNLISITLKYLLKM